MIDVVYRDEFAGTATGVADALPDKAGLMFAFHSITTLGAVLMVRLRRRACTAGCGPRPPDGLAPVVALVGLAGTAVVTVLGAGLDTEFMMPIAQDDGIVDDGTAAIYNHWIGTIPWLLGARRPRRPGPRRRRPRAAASRAGSAGSGWCSAA